MHKRAFQALKRTFMHVSGLPHHILIIKLNYKVFGFIIKYGGGRPETCINVRFRPETHFCACLSSSPTIF